MKLINKVLGYFVPNKKQTRYEFYDVIARENYQRLVFVSLFYFLFEIYIASTVQVGNPRLEMMSKYMMTFQFIVFLFSCWNVFRGLIFNGKVSQILVSIYGFIVMYWALEVSLDHIHKTGSITMVVITLTALSAILFRRIIVVLITNIGAYAYFSISVLTLRRFPPKSLLMRPGSIRLFMNDLILITLMSCILGVIVWRLRLRIFNEHKQLENQATVDSMTGVLNHRAICEILSHEIERVERYHEPLCAMIIDIDDFKNVNDTFGHQFGDEVIQSVSNTMKNTLRETDSIGRYGGDEFLIVLPNTHIEDAKDVGHRLLDAISKIEYSRTCDVSISCGLVEHDDHSKRGMIQLADDALYQAKRSGKNTIAF